MTPCYTPVVMDGDRRCDTCRMLPEEHPEPVYIATLDTGGIAYSGATITAVATTEDAAREAVFLWWRGSDLPSRREHPELTTVDKVNDWFGIRVFGPLPLDGAAERVD